MSINLDETDDFSLKLKKKKATGVKVIFYLNNKK